MVRDEGRPAARLPPSRRRPDRRRRSSSRSRRCRLPASRPRGRSSSGRPRPGRTGRAGPWRDRTAAARGPTALDPIAVDLSRPHPGHERVPVVVGSVRGRVDPDDAGRAGVVLAVEEQEFDARGGPREQAEVDAAVDDGGTQGGASADRLGRAAPGGRFVGGVSAIVTTTSNSFLSAVPWCGTALVPARHQGGRLNSLPRLCDVVPEP